MSAASTAGAVLRSEAENIRPSLYENFTINPPVYKCRLRFIFVEDLSIFGSSCIVILLERSGRQFPGLYSCRITNPVRLARTPGGNVKAAGAAPTCLALNCGSWSRQS